MISLYKPYISKDTLKNVSRCIKQNWISSKGFYVKKFEKLFSKFTKIKYSVSVANGTCAMHIALLSLGIKKNDEVIVPSFTYVATANPIKYIGAKPVFVESNLQTLQIDTKKIEKKINNKTKAIICPHLYGNMTNIDELIKLKKKYNLFLIEDCAESFGSYYKKKHSGNFGEVSTFSFYGNKTITTGEGGMICTNNKKIADIANKLKTQGVVRAKHPYYHDVIGYNYRMTNICAAIGVSQLKKSKFIINQKRKIFDRYAKKINFSNKIRILKESKNVRSSYWLVVIILDNKIIKKKLEKFLTKNRIETRPTFYPLHKLPIYYSNKIFKNAELLGTCGLCLPSYPSIKNSEIEYISKKINQFFDEIK
jgi:perosamine synthetase